MKRAHCNPARLGVLLGGCILFSVAFATTPPVDERPDAATQMRIAADYGKLPIAFEANQGQADASVRFLARGQGYGLFLTAIEAVLTLRAGASEPAGADAANPVARKHATPKATTQPGTVVRMRLAGANPNPQVSGVDALPGISNYFIGNDPARWHTTVPNYAKVKYAEVYPGIDLIYYGNQRQLEYDFIVAPGADPKRIALAFMGVKNLELDAEGNLVLSTASGQLVQHKPLVYQDIDGVRHEVDGRYVLRGNGRASFQVAAYDTTRPLVIDPTLAYSTYLGGGGTDSGNGIAVDSSGNAYVTGSTNGNFPTTYGGGTDVFVVKLNAAGNALLYSTILGGSATDIGYGIAVDGSGNAYITGFTGSSNFPTTAGAVQTTYGSGLHDAFVAKLNAAGSTLVYSTYLGSSGDDYGQSIAVDDSGNAYVAGQTTGSFPTAGAYQAIFGGVQDAFVAKVNAAGNALVYSTYLGGGGAEYGYGIAVDGSGNAYVTGVTGSHNFPTTVGAYQTLFGGVADAFVAKVNTNAVGPASLVYSTYLGGSAYEGGWDIAVDGSGDAYVTGRTAGNFPTTPGAYQAIFGGFEDAFVAKLNAVGSVLVYSTYLGGSGYDEGMGIAVDGSGNAYVIGKTTGGFPTNPVAVQPTAPGNIDAFVAKLNATGSTLLYATYLGGSSDDYGFGIAVDGSGNAYVTGSTAGGIPTTAGALQTGFGGRSDAFVAKFALQIDLTPILYLLLFD